MNLFFLKLRKTMYFKRWTRKSSAVFSSMHSYIKISALALCYFILNTFNTEANNKIVRIDTVRLQDVTIKAYKTKITLKNTARIVNTITAKDLKVAPVTSIPDALKSVMNVDVRERGVYGIQSDMNIRGGSFEQNVILLNGVRMTDPQTGHLQMNLPVDVFGITGIELLKGASSGLFGNNAFSGAVNFVTGSDNANNIKTTVFGGEYGLFGVNVSINQSSRNVKNYYSISKKKSDGYLPNTDFDVFNIFYKGKFITKAGYFQLQTGFLDKSFGAFNFYTPKFPNQFEHNKTFINNLKFFSSGKKIKINPSIYWRRNYDRFELFRGKKNAPSWYKKHNYHRTDVYGADVTTIIPSAGLGSLALNIDWNTEYVLSNNIGDKLINDSILVAGEEDIYYDRSKARNNYNISVDKQINFDNLFLSIQFLTNYNSMFDWNFYPGINLNYSLNESLNIISSVNWSGRVPSYTELYYNAGDSKGNINLKAEKANTYEVGAKYSRKSFFIQSAVYYRKSKNIIDWTRKDKTEKWQARNISDIDAVGFDFISRWNPKEVFSDKFPINYILFNYSYINMDRNSYDFSSKYILDYLKHNVSLSINYDIITENLTASWQANFYHRNGTYKPYINGEYRANKEYKPTFLLDLKLNYKMKMVNVFAQVKNIFDTKNQAIENVSLPGRWISGGISVNFDFKK